MIMDRLENWTLYFGDALDVVAEYLRTVGASAPEGDHELRGQDVFARVLSYKTRNRTEAIMEAHRRYIDFQMVLSGVEVLEWHPLQGLAEISKYDPDKGLVLLEKPRRAHGCAVLTADRIGVFFPQDAHMGGISFEEPALIRKVVVKVAVDLLRWA